jgi:hypothetical protein
MNQTRVIRLVSLALLALVPAVVATSSASADVRISRAELNGTQLRLEGTAIANRTITVDGVAMGTSDGAGNFKIQRDPFPKPADCTVDVNDGSATPTAARLAGCTVTAASPPPPPPPPPPPSSTTSLSTIRVNPTDVIGPNPSTGTATLTAAAPAGGFVVSLSSDNTAAANVPPSVTVPAGATSANFTVTTNAVTNAQSALIIGTDGTVRTYDIVTVWDEFHFNHGSVSVFPGGNGGGRVTSQPAGIDCVIANGNGAGGTCSAFYLVGTVVKLTAVPDAQSKFVGFRPTPGCIDASKITVARGTNHACQVGFQLK